MFGFLKNKKAQTEISVNILPQKTGVAIDSEDLTRILKIETNNKTSLDEMISAFEEMNNHPLNGVDAEEDSVLFETGVFDFTGEKQFYFSLTRQFPDEKDEEYTQLHMDILYSPDICKHKLSQTTWSDELDFSIFEYVRNSKEYAALKDLPLGKVNIYMEQT
ncbi:MAG: hypothetical protein IKK29_03065 [Christensenellaceae bacterium]|nr:hypothetical protein [Christensenellaceae bacterium]